jgi:hypothetical protein
MSRGEGQVEKSVEESGARHVCLGCFQQTETQSAGHGWYASEMWRFATESVNDVPWQTVGDGRH